MHLLIISDQTSTPLTVCLVNLMVGFKCVEYGLEFKVEPSVLNSDLGHENSDLGHVSWRRHDT